MLLSLPAGDSAKEKENTRQNQNLLLLEALCIPHRKSRIRQQTEKEVGEKADAALVRTAQIGKDRTRKRSRSVDISESDSESDSDLSDNGATDVTQSVAAKRAKRTKYD